MRRIFILGGITYILLLLALTSTSGVILSFMLPFMVYLGLGFFFTPRRSTFSAARSLSKERALPGEEIEINLVLTNHGGTVEIAQITDLLPEGLEIVDGENQLLTSFSPEESLEIQYTLRGPRGGYHFPGIQITTSDSLQVRQRESYLEIEDKLFIQPPVLNLKRLEIRPRRTRVYAGFIPARRGGPGVEFFGVREYQPGDPMRWINWRASARHSQRLFINNFEQERVADVGVIVDTRLRSEIRGENGASLFESSVQAAAALSETFLQFGNRVGLLMFGTMVDWTLPDYGKIQRERILGHLAAVQVGDSLVFDELENLPTRLLPPQSQIIFISPLQETDIPVLVNLRARGYAVIVISPNPISFETMHTNTGSSDLTVASRLAGLERAVLIRKLEQAGVKVLDWHTHIPLDQALRSLPRW